MKRILLVTADLQGPIRNGGVGTSFTHLARMLSREYHVEILFADEDGGDDLQKWDIWTKMYARQGIRLRKISVDSVEVFAHKWARTSYFVYETIKNENHDLIVFHDMYGLGYYTLQAKKLGLAFTQTPILTKFLGPLTWSRRENGIYWRHDEIYLPMFERLAVELSDEIQTVSPWSRQWMREQGWNPPRGFETFFPLNLDPKLKKHSRDVTPKSEELVFFGRLEKRKGISDFLHAAEELIQENRFPFRRITFLGRYCCFDGDNLRQALAGFVFRFGSRVKIQILDQMDSRQALRYLQTSKAIAAVLSESETMGFTLFECMALGIPVIASDIEPFRKLVGTRNRHKLVPVHSSRKLKQALMSRLTLFDSTRASQLVRQTESAWLKNIRRLIKTAPRPQPASSEATMAVLITHFNRPRLLERALESLASQTVLPEEILVYDDASSDPAVKSLVRQYRLLFQNRGVDFRAFFSKRNRGPSFGRNFLAKKSRSDFLLFMDDDNLAVIDEVEKLKKMQAHSRADVITGVLAKFVDGQESLWKPRSWVPLGFDIATSVLQNGMGDTNFLVRKSLFKKVGGFIDNPTFKAEDLNVLVKCSLEGARMWVCPEPLVKYRLHGLNRSAIRVRNERRYHAGYPFSQFVVDKRAQNPRFSLDPIIDNLVAAADELGAAWKTEPPFVINQKKILDGSEAVVDLWPHISKIFKQMRFQRFGGAYQVSLSSRAHVQLDLRNVVLASSPGFLKLLMSCERPAEITCTNSFYREELTESVVELLIPMAKEMLQQPFELKLIGLRRFFVSDLKWIPVSQRESN